jgi:hypothetical protein
MRAMARRAVTVIACAAVLAGCGGAPAHSAPAACRDFRAWLAAQHGNLHSGKDAAQLRAAVAEAPSGHLYEDLGILRANVTFSRPAASAGTGAASVTAPDAAGVLADCQSVN